MLHTRGTTGSESRTARSTIPLAPQASRPQEAPTPITSLPLSSPAPTTHLPRSLLPTRKMVTKGRPPMAALRAGELFDTPMTESGGCRTDLGTRDTSTVTPAMTTSTMMAPPILPPNLLHSIAPCPSPQPTPSLRPSSLFEIAISTPLPSQAHPPPPAALPVHHPSPLNHIQPPFPFLPFTCSACGSSFLT